MIVGALDANPAQLKLALHAAQLRVGGRLDHVRQISVDAAQCGTDADTKMACSRPAEAVAARGVCSGDEMRSIIIMDQIAEFFVACEKVGIFDLRRQLGPRANGSKMRRTA
jgi:hypothetical protein